MDAPFAARMGKMQKSFVRELLKVAQDPSFITFAGGLPNPVTFPIEQISIAAEKVMTQHGTKALQYGVSMGYEPLRKWIANRYQEKYGMNVTAENILITNGSQQALDLIAKAMLDPGDKVIVEAPSYMGGIHALRLYEPVFDAVPLNDDGIDTAVLAQKISDAKLVYTLPNFQNPTGISYTPAIKKEVAEIFKSTRTHFIEDDPYNELRFSGEDTPPLFSYAPELGFLMGSFSKVVSPGMRMGWICGPLHLMDKILIAKQASDLHSNQLSQYIIHQFMLDNDYNAHLKGIQNLYKNQRDLMVAAIKKHFPSSISHTIPEGGMFLWTRLPEGMDALKLFDKAVEQKVVFVPGQPFFTDGSGQNALRISFSMTPAEQIDEGVQRLARAIKTY
ncbi:MAG: PLP-dependent aminotransferase family protein [Chloroflexota bacterium]